MYIFAHAVFAGLVVEAHTDFTKQLDLTLPSEWTPIVSKVREFVMFMMTCSQHLVLRLIPAAQTECVDDLWHTEETFTHHKLSLQPGLSTFVSRPQEYLHGLKSKEIP